MRITETQLRRLIRESIMKIKVTKPDNPWMHDQLWVWEEIAIKYGWTKETSPIQVINPSDEIWKDSEYEWIKEEA